MATDLEHAVLDEAPGEVRRPAGAGPGADGDGRGGRALAVALPLLLLVVAGALRFADLGEPGRIYFDETYYANDAQQYLERGVEEDFAVHPPAGKWLLAGGIALFGFDSYGWRFSAAVAGTLTVLVLYLAGLRLFRRRGIAALAALLLTVDGLAFTMSRIAMLDVFLALFVVTGFWLLLVDRDRQWAGVEAVALGEGSEPDAALPLPRRPHWARWLAGLAFGLALATKWSALLAIAAAGLFVLVSELAFRRRVTGRLLVQPGRLIASGLLTLVAVPVVVYLLSYSGWFTNFENTRRGLEACPDGVCAGVGVLDVANAWIDEQFEIARFHENLEAEHPYRASASTWFLMTRPVAYYWESCDQPPEAGEDPCAVGEGNVAEIIGMGNPVIWWLALAAYPVLGAFAVARREWRAWAILGFLVLQTLPWHLTPRPVFLFYMTPAVPFVCLSLAYVSWRAMGLRATRWVPAALLALAVGAFLFFHPVLVGAELSRNAWDLRMWFSTWV
jgi:dolichyl-phosphate-mannose--protein O-mannosyl transferase